MLRLITDSTKKEEGKAHEKITTTRNKSNALNGSSTEVKEYNCEEEKHPYKKKNKKEIKSSVKKNLFQGSPTHKHRAHNFLASRGSAMDELKRQETKNKFKGLGVKLRKNYQLVNYNGFNKFKFCRSDFTNLMKIPPLERTPEQCSMIAFYIENSNFCRKLQSENIDQSLFKKLYIICATYLVGKNYPPNMTLYRREDLDEFFYLIVKGSVTLYSPKIAKKKLNGLEFYNKICELHDKNESILLELTVGDKDNQAVFPLSLEEAANIKKIYMKIIYDENEKKRPLKDEDFRRAGLFPEDFGLTNIDSLPTTRVFDVLDENLHDILPESCEHLKAILAVTEQKDINIYEYKPEKVVKEGDFFGEGIRATMRYRHNAIINKEECFLCQINKDIYLEQLKEEKEKLHQKDLNFLMDNYFFYDIVKRKFDRHYFELFQKCYIKKGEILFNQDDPVDYIYFIQSGSVELTSTKSVLEIHSLINDINKFNKTNNDDTIMNDKRFPNILKTNSLYEMMPKLSEKNKNNLFIMGANEILSADYFYFNTNNLCTAKVVNDSCIFKISVKDLITIFNENKRSVLPIFDEYIMKKQNVLQNRLSSIEACNLELIDQKIVDKKLDEALNKKSPSLNRNSYVNNSKISEIIEKNNNHFKTMEEYSSIQSEYIHSTKNIASYETSHNNSTDKETTYLSKIKEENHSKRKNIIRTTDKLKRLGIMIIEPKKSKNFKMPRIRSIEDRMLSKINADQFKSKGAILSYNNQVISFSDIFSNKAASNKSSIHNSEISNQLDNFSSIYLTSMDTKENKNINDDRKIPENLRNIIFQEKQPQQSPSDKDKKKRIFKQLSLKNSNSTKMGANIFRNKLTQAKIDKYKVFDYYLNTTKYKTYKIDKHGGDLRLFK